MIDKVSSVCPAYPPKQKVNYEPKPKFKCFTCKSAIFSGDEYVEFEHKNFCCNKCLYTYLLDSGLKQTKKA